MTARVHYNGFGDITTIGFATDDPSPHISVSREVAIEFLDGTRVVEDWFVGADGALLPRQSHLTVEPGEPASSGAFSLNVIIPTDGDKIVVHLSSRYTNHFTAEGRIILRLLQHDMKWADISIDLDDILTPKVYSPPGKFSPEDIGFQLMTRIQNTKMVVRYSSRRLEEEIRLHKEEVRTDFSPRELEFVVSSPDHPCVLLWVGDNEIEISAHHGGGPCHATPFILYRTDGDLDTWESTANSRIGQTIAWKLGEGETLYATPAFHNVYAIRKTTPSHTPKGTQDITFVRSPDGFVVRNASDETPLITILHDGAPRSFMATDGLRVDLGRMGEASGILASQKVGWRSGALRMGSGTTVDLASGSIVGRDMTTAKEIDYLDLIARLETNNYDVIIDIRGGETIIHSRVILKNVLMDGVDRKFDIPVGKTPVSAKYVIVPTTNIPYYSVLFYRDE